MGTYMNNRQVLTTYLAGYIEEQPETAFDWRNIAYEELYIPEKMLVYDPIRQELGKTGQPAGAHCEYIRGLKKAGRYEQFDEEMDKIWLGHCKNSPDLIRMFKLFQDRALIDGNKEEEMKHWGDYEAVARSDFIIAYMKQDIQTVGTIGEIFEAMLLSIPVYLVIDTPKTETNSSLLRWVRYSGGDIFYELKDCLTFIKKKYGLN